MHTEKYKLPSMYTCTQDEIHAFFVVYMQDIINKLAPEPDGRHWCVERGCQNLLLHDASMYIFIHFQNHVHVYTCTFLRVHHGSDN